ncbi:MAG: hypothetical protein OXR84_15680, partial [Magnetovibrio sp.]|nr:hypothetical protein [Magnetovibrio sp.]
MIARSEADDWAAIARELESGLAGTEPGAGARRLGFLYVTDNLADDLSALLTYLRQATGIDDWTGSVGMGICWGDGDGGGEAFGRPAAAALVAAIPDAAFAM